MRGGAAAEVLKIEFSPAANPLANVPRFEDNKQMKHLRLTLLLCTIAASPAAAAEHPCSQDAKQRAENLLRLHFVMDAGDPPSHFSDQEVTNLGIDEKVVVLKPIKALVGKGKLDVLEVQGYIYKANYRMRMIYAQIKGSCLLMGQEILEMSNPY